MAQHFGTHLTALPDYGGRAATTGSAVFLALLALLLIGFIFAWRRR